MFQCFRRREGFGEKMQKRGKPSSAKFAHPKKFAKGDGSPILLEHWNKALLFPSSL
jgi:hypothetical protein